MIDEYYSEVKEHIKKKYYKIGGQYQKRYLSDAGIYVLNKKIRKVISCGNFNTGDTILDVGCADGPFVFELAKMGYNPVGIDLSRDNIEWAIKNAETKKINNVKFFVSDVENLSIFEDNTFDGAFSLNVLRYVPDPQRAINEVYRVLRKGKCFVADFPNKYSLYFYLIRPLVRGNFRKFNTKCGYLQENLVSIKQVKNWFSKAGFKDIYSKMISYPQTQTPDNMLNIAKIIDVFAELPIINFQGPIFLCFGRK